MIYSPLGLFDCCPTTDGAAAVVVCRADLASDVHAASRCGRSASGSRWSPASRTTSRASATSASTPPCAPPRRRTRQAGVGPEDVDFAEVHDCFTITEILNYEDLGLLRPRRGRPLRRGGPRVARRREAGEPVGRPQVVRTSDRRHRRAHDLRADHAAARPRRRAPGEGRAASAWRTTWAVPRPSPASRS